MITVSPNPFSDLAIALQANVSAPGFVPQTVAYTVIVENVGSVPTTSSTVAVIPIPQGTTISFVNPPCGNDTNNVTCPVPTLAPGQSVSYSFVVNAVSSTGVVSTTAVVDPNQFITNDVNRNNNFASSAVSVLPVTITASITALPTSTLVATPVPAEVPAQPVPVPPAPVEPAPVQPAPAPALPSPEGNRWIQILQPTEAQNNEGEVLWIAQPGELYFVVREESGWVLAIYEGDTPFWQEWIPLDNRVQNVVLDRGIPGGIGPLWLVVFAPVDTYYDDGSPAWVANPGEWYYIVDQQGRWVRAFYDGDSPANAVWFSLDYGIDLAVADPPGPTGTL